MTKKSKKQGVILINNGFMMSYHEVVLLLCYSQNLSQKSFSQKFGFSFSTFKKWAQGQVVPSEKNKKRLQAIVYRYFFSVFYFLIFFYYFIEKENQKRNLRSAFANIALEGYSVDSKMEREILEIKLDPSSKKEKIARWQIEMESIAG